MENSSDLERAPGARSIGEEFFDATILVVEYELQWCENMGFHFHAAPFGSRSPPRSTVDTRPRDVPDRDP